ncbi:ABC transporter ATP-binding protein [Effusibacillus dendaii]|uniref:Multidrug ABC transporter ATP-binding protein n=1 Tax=Effusibacillus dendaii TaxID=2743772 RepID=A0A7I8DF60_9BACL|nr:ABC transporter transmembrane domain-containing protein [Effusibacillus dendaii]BCJ87589.1 multidrug ABC transporter ATP-binding protein [Effusibacillus dendaii]
MVMYRLIRYMKPHRKELVIAFGLLLIATASDLAGPKLIQIFIDRYLIPHHWVISQLAWLAGTYLFLLVLSAIMHYWQLVSFQRIALQIIQRLRIDVFSHVQRLGLEFFDKTPTGSIISRITNDTEAVKDLFVSVLSTFVQNIVFLLGIFAAMFLLDVRLASLCLLLLPAILLLMQVYRQTSAKIYRVLRSKLSELNAKLNESLQGMHVIQVMRQEKRVLAEYGQINRENYQAARRNIRLGSLLLRPAVDLIYTLTLILVLGFFGFHTQDSPVQIGVLYAFVNYLDRFFEPVNTMMQRLSQLQQAVVSAERVFQLMDDQRLAPVKQGTKNPKIGKGMIEFQNVSFSYDGKTDVLKNITFTACPGQTIALVGHTGSGKSTVINLLMRFYPVTQGSIRLDGVPLDAYDDEELRGKIGLVLQDPFLFVGDVSENIRLHNQEISDADIVQAAKFVQADSFIDKLPNGYGEPVSERGANFSSGQRQLLSFARTMARNPKILVLDEATANVDTETEEAIQTALEKMRKGRTTIAIAHRLSTIQDADLILVLHRGEIVESGTHQELLAKEGLYYKMYLLQQGSTAAV